jgi:hypothetical protein
MTITRLLPLGLPIAISMGNEKDAKESLSSCAWAFSSNNEDKH